MHVCPECGEGGGKAHRPDDGALLSPADDPLLGETLGSYRVVRLIGRGGMGSVYLAIQPNIGSRVAIKALSPEASESRELVERFFAEARAVNLITPSPQLTHAPGSPEPPASGKRTAPALALRV